MGVLPVSKYTFYKCHLSPAVNDPAIKWKQLMMMVTLVKTIKKGKSHFLSTSYYICGF